MMSTFLKKMVHLSLGTTLLSTVVSAQTPTVKVDLNFAGKTELECNDPNYVPWIGDNAISTSKTVDGVTFTFKKLGSNGTALRTNWYKAGVQAPHYARLVGDCIYVDGGNSGAEIELTISGLSTGTHSFMMYHNAVDGTTTGYAPIDIYLNGTKVIDNQPHSHRSLSIAGSESSYITFNATAGQNVKILYKAETGTSDGVKNVYLNAFELNTPNIKAQATTPIPGDGDVHFDAEGNNSTLSWSAASSAVSHNIYFSTLKSEVESATTSSACYEGNQTATTFTTGALDVMNTYYWRVDEVASNGVVTKGNVWMFRPRQLAFPGAEGYGRYAIGGRGGKVVHVTNLNDDNSPGSLRYAVENESGPRTIVFDIAGVITLKSRLVLSDPYVTVAGQTAPGKGICIKSAPFGFTGNNVIARHMRLRLGAGPTYDGMGMTGANHSILDHCSISWTIDESFSSRSGKNITLQKTLISEALNAANHQNYPAGTEHGYAATIGGEIGSFHHNLLAHNYGRNWSLGGGLDGSGYYAGKISIVNNVVYNWGGRTTDGGAQEVDFINNYYKPGAGSKKFVALSIDHENNGPGTQRAYFAGNKMPGHFDESNQEDGRTETFSNGDSWKYECFVNSQFSPSYVTTQTADHAYKLVLSDVGANQPQFDNHDLRMINETKNGTYSVTGSVTGKPGFPDHQDDAGGYESYPTTSRTSNWDSDKDGLPDFWEDYLGTSNSSSSGDFSDANDDSDKNGYTNLEEYLNWLAETHYILPENGSQEIDLAVMFRGFTSSPQYSYTSLTGGTVTISGTKATYKASRGGLSSFVVKVTDAQGHTMSRTIGIFVDAPIVANEAPVVSLDSPLDNASTSLGNTVTIAATASDDKAVSKVVFYVTEKATNIMTAITTDSNEPYSCDWTPTVSGIYYLVAKATDSDGVVSNSNILTYTVNEVVASTYSYSNKTADKQYATALNWDKNIVPTAIDTAIIISGEAQVKDDINAYVKVEDNGIFRMIGYYTVPYIELHGGTLKVYTSNTAYGLNANVVVKTASTIMAGSQNTSVFNFDGTFSGSENLEKTSVGVLQLNNASNSYDGDWNISEGKIKSRASRALGTGSVIVQSGAILDIESVGSVAGCDTLIIEKGGSLIIDATVDTANYLKIDGVFLKAGTYSASDYPTVISGTGSIVVLQPEFTSIIDEFATDGYKLIVAPNPTKDIAKIIYTINEGREILLTIYNSNAKKVLRKKVSVDGTKILIDEINSFTKGVYFVEMRVDGERKSVVKFVKID